MRKAKVVSAIALPFFFIVGILAVSGHADKPGSPPGLSKPKPELLHVIAKGAIFGQGAPANIAITFSDTFKGIDVDESGSFIANPDEPPAFTVSGNNRHKRLNYYYCDAATHESGQLKDGICDDRDNHDFFNYKNLRISGGMLEKNTGHIVFPRGSTWRIYWKETMAQLIEGTLDEKVTLITKWSTP